MVCGFATAPNGAFPLRLKTSRSASKDSRTPMQTIELDGDIAVTILLLASKQQHM
eukprot:m.569282 g.569282  ORF g.569282 m.569282 type:complete len:55 (-) comp22258_c0_seq28:1163-1327(-)